MMLRKLNNTRLLFVVSADIRIILMYILMAFIFWHPILIGGRMIWVGDVVRQYFPWYSILHAHLRNFSLPLWIPEMGNGYPLLAQGETGVFYPLNWLLIALFSPLEGFKLIYPVHFFIASLGGYLLARQLRQTHLAAFLTGTVFAYGFFFTARTIHVSIIIAASFLPYGLVVIENMINTGRNRRGFWLSAVIALQLLGGHPQIALIATASYIFIALVRLFLLRKTNFLRQLTIILIWIFIGWGIAGVQLLPTLELATYSSRIYQNLDFVFSYSLPRSQFLTYVFPYLFGLTPQNSNLGYMQFGGHYWEFALYIGILPLILAIIGGSRLHRNKHALVYVSGCVMFALLAVGGYLSPYRFLVRILHLPFRVSARFILPLSLCLSLLAGMGFDTLLQSQKPKQTKKLLKFGFIILIVWVSSATIVSLWSQNMEIAKINGVLSHLLQKFVFTEFQNVQFADFSAFRPDIFISLFLVIVAGTVIALLNNSSKWRFALIFLSFGLIFIDSYLQGFLYQQTEKYAALNRPDYIDRFGLTNGKKVFTVTKPGNLEFEKSTLQPNLGLLWGISSFNAVTPLPLMYHEEVYALVQTQPNILSLLGVEYVLSTGHLKDANLTFLGSSGTTYVYKVHKSLPRFYLAEKLFSPTSTDVNNSLVEKQVGQSKNTLQLDLPGQLYPDESDRIESQITVNFKEETRLDLSSNSSHEGWFVVQDSYYPAWQAFIDGVHVSIKRANWISRAVYLSQGRHRIEFRYVPYSLYFGMILSGMSLGMAVILYRTKWMN